MNKNEITEMKRIKILLKEYNSLELNIINSTN